MISAPPVVAAGTVAVSAAVPSLPVAVSEGAVMPLGNVPPRSPHCGCVHEKTPVVTARDDIQLLALQLRLSTPPSVDAVGPGRSEAGIEGSTDAGSVVTP